MSTSLKCIIGINTKPVLLSADLFENKVPFAYC